MPFVLIWKGMLLNVRNVQCLECGIFLCNKGGENMYLYKYWKNIQETGKNGVDGEREWDLSM